MKQWAIAFLTIILSAKMVAQFNVHGELGVLADDNIDNNYLRIIDRITIPSLTLSYGLSHDVQEANFFYTGTMNYYSLNTARTYQLHSIGGEYTRMFGDESETTLEAKLSYAARVDRTEFTVYDYSQILATASLKHFFTETSLGQVSYNFRSMIFRELTDFNFTEHILSAKYSQQFSTATTVILNVDLGGKVYSSSNESMNTSGMNSRGMNSLIQWLPSVIQTIGSVRVGQSVWEGTGLSVLAQYQLNLRKQTRYISSEYGLISDDAIFDDHYGYEGLMLQGMLTQKLPYDAQIRWTLSSQDRLYANFPVFDLTGDQLSGQRNDTRTTSTIQMTKSFQSLGMELVISYDYIINTSNDPIYDYTNNAFTVGVSVPF
jgi:hypothetical protein